MVDPNDPRELDRALGAEILDLLSQRGPGKTICPSEAARAVFRDVSPSPGNPDGDEGWRELMSPARRAAARLVASGDIVVTQGGEVVDIETAKGPVRLGRPAAGHDAGGPAGKPGPAGKSGPAGNSGPAGKSGLAGK